MSEPAEAICDALVAYVKTLNATSTPAVSLQATIKKTENPKGELKYEHQQLAVLFFPLSEEAEKMGRGGQCLERFTIAMIVVRKLSEEFTRAKLARYTREIKAAVRSAGKMADATFSADATPVLADADQINELNQYSSVSEFAYTKAGTDG